MDCKISILHPSYGRPQQAVNIVKEIINNASDSSKLEYLIGLDDIDPLISKYKELFNYVDEINKVSKFEINIGNSINGIQAINRLARIISSTSELLISVSDDLHFPIAWDITLLNVLKDINNFTEPKFLLISEGFYQTPEKFNTDFSNDEEYGYNIVNRAFYNKLGYFIWPEYTHYGADVDIFNVAKKLNAVIDARYILIKHDYYQQDPSHYDTTHARKNIDKEWQTSFRILAERRSRNFDL